MKKKKITLHYHMYAGLGEHKVRTFLVHSVILDSIRKECPKPERDFFPFLRKTPLRYGISSPGWLLPSPRSLELAFEDMGVLKDPMDKRMDLLHKRSWQIGHEQFK